MSRRKSFQLEYGKFDKFYWCTDFLCNISSSFQVSLFVGKGGNIQKKKHFSEQYGLLCNVLGPKAKYNTSKNTLFEKHKCN